MKKFYGRIAFFEYECILFREGFSTTASSVILFFSRKIPNRYCCVPLLGRGKGDNKDTDCQRRRLGLVGRNQVLSGGKFCRWIQNAGTFC